VFVEESLIGLGVCEGKVELSHRIHRHHVKVGVRYFETSNHQPDSSWSKYGHLRSTDRVSNGGQMTSGRRTKVGPQVALLARNDKSVPGSERTDVEEADGEVVFPQHPRRNRAIDYLRKNACHTAERSVDTLV